MSMEKFLAWKIMPRFMMLVMTGAMTGAFAVWLGSEK
jgi:hypothetical protein